MCIPHQEKMLSIIHFLFSRNVMLLFCKFRGLFLSYLKHSLTHFKLHMDRNDLSKREGTQAFLTTICHLNIIHTIQKTWQHPLLTMLCWATMTSCIRPNVMVLELLGPRSKQNIIDLQVLAIWICRKVLWI